MFKKTIEFTDYNGERRKEDKYFNLTKAEILEMQVSESGGLTTFLKKILMEKDNKKIMQYYKDVILTAYGEKSPDGKYFKKTEEIRQEFEWSPAYSELFMELLNNPNAQREFIQGILPSDIAAEIKKEIEAGTFEEEMKEFLPTTTPAE